VRNWCLIHRSFCREKVALRWNKIARKPDQSSATTTEEIKRNNKRYIPAIAERNRGREREDTELLEFDHEQDNNKFSSVETQVKNRINSTSWAKALDQNYQVSPCSADTADRTPRAR